MGGKLLVLCFFPAFHPGASGGELRLLNLYKALSRFHTITLVTSTDFGARHEEVYHTPTFKEIRLPKDNLWRRAYLTLGRSGIEGELSGLAFALAVADPRCRLRQAARDLAGDAELVIHEFPYSEPIFADGLAAGREIYNAHNFETSLLGSIADGPGFETGLLKLMRLEGNLVARARRVFATGTADAEKFRLFFGLDEDRLELCPNGFDPDELAGVGDIVQAETSRPRLLFFGSGHRPNVEAAHALIRLAPALPDCDLVLAGGVVPALGDLPLPANIIALGPFDPGTKIRLLGEADLFVNPVVLGSGTSLKALDALGAGVPLLSTPEGVRGLDLVPGQHAEIVPRDGFAQAIRSLIADPAARQALAASGRALAHERHTWARIAERLRDALAAKPRATVPRPAPLLALNDYPVPDTRSGGKSRIRNLLGHLGTDVILVSFGPACDFALLGEGFLHVTVPKSREHQAFEAAANAGQPLSVDDCVATLFAASNRILTAVVARVAERAGLVVFEHCYMAPLLDTVWRVRPGLPVVYSAHNVEALHRTRMLEDHSSGDAFGDLVREIEARLVARARLVVCCTEADCIHFAESGAETLLVPNGCAMPSAEALKRRHRPERAARPRIGFMGSSHGPNVEAARFVVDELAPAFPAADFELVGDIGSALAGALPSNVRSHGSVDEAGKTRVLSGWTVALNPVTSGGGSSLKLPDFMAHGLPTLNTPAGARGFAVVAEGAGDVVDRAEMAERLAMMLADTARLETQRRNARRYAARELGWAGLLRPYADQLRRWNGEAPRRPRTRSLLVVTYRYTEPPLGGAEEYLVAVLKHLRHRFDRIDLAAIDVKDVANQHHFGCRFDTVGEGAPARVGELFDQALYFPPDLPQAEALVEGCRRLEREWMAAEFDLLLPFARALIQPGRIRLMGGFYGPEDHGGVTRRWTSPTFSFLLPPETRTVHLTGFAHGEKTFRTTLIRVMADGAPGIVDERSDPVGRWFDIDLAMPPPESSDPWIVFCEVDEHQVAGDHRPLGVLLETAGGLFGEGAGSGGLSRLHANRADLAEDVEQALRSRHPDAWMAALQEAARVRSAAVEADFAAVRGPHSAALQGWLAKHAGDYDVALVQGIPFDLIPSTVATLKSLATPPRTVLLPHFHADDRFYHWRRYQESFAAADAVLLFSRLAADRMAGPATFAIVPGGGVEPTEPADLAAAACFRAVHPAGEPFFLVLGRKTGPKGYARVVAARRALAGAGRAPDLVLIGPDEDGIVIDEPGVRYLGRQAREVVRGALAACTGVVSMSLSESFGIVLCEAWMFRKPVIANRLCEASREMVEDGETGLLVATDAELADAMRLLAADGAVRDRIGSAGFRQVVTRYGWAEVATRVASALEG